MGGHFNYVGETVHEVLDELGDNEEVRRRWPILSTVMKELGAWVEQVEEEIDNELDVEYKGADQVFDRASVSNLVDRVTKLIPHESR